VEANLFTETEEQKKKIKEVKEAKEKVQFYTNEIKRINALENEQDWHGYLDSINLEYLMR